MTTPALTAGPRTERFMNKVVLDPNTGCWLWSGCLNSRGYPIVGFDNKRHLAHRVAFVTWKGEIPEGLQLDHVCEVPRCVNPDHLEAVTALENVRRSNHGYFDRPHIPDYWLVLRTFRALVAVRRRDFEQAAS